MAHDQVVDRRDGRLVAQQALGRHHDQRLAEVPPDLAAKQVEVLGRRRGDGDLDVLLGAEREEALQAGAGVLGPLALVAVRQEHHQAAAPAPLRLGRGDELVDDHLGAVGEVAELGLPHDQHVGLVERVAVVEAEHGRLGEQAVVDAELGLVPVPGGSAGVQRSPVCWSISTACRWLKVPRRLSWPLSRTGVPSSSSEPNARVSANAQSTAPRDSSVLTRPAKMRASLGLTLKPGGGTGRGRGDGLERVERDAGLDRLERVPGREAGPRPGGEAGRDGSRLDAPHLHLLEDLLQLLGEGLGDRLGLLAGELARHHELLGVELADADPVLDLLVHSGWVNPGSSPSLWPCRR